ncbi:prepilin peptidase [Paenibacillus donghaensis]|uniref:Prepilin peptidase n=2 Tax=Paenibacillus donghaensis TaxID=414771 RepID=A0A2Z2KH56_9BACL|nr:prepilin peptidase [Paenibacillus donghaensis]
MAEWAFWGCLPFLAAALITDTLAMRIPNWITLSAWGAGMLVQGIMGGWQGLLFAGAGSAAGFAIMLLMHLMGAVGAGDVKLFAGIGAWTGLLFTLQVMVYSVLFGALIGWIIVLWSRQAGNVLKTIAGRITGLLWFGRKGLVKSSSSELLKFPFMLAVIPGSFCAYLYL